MKKPILWWVLGLLNGWWIGATVAGARAIDLKSAGIPFWIFLGLCFLIILLQLVPALLLVLAATGIIGGKHVDKDIKLDNNPSSTEHNDCCGRGPGGDVCDCCGG